MNESKVLGIFLTSGDRSIGWLADSSGILFQTTSRGCAEAQIERFQEWNYMHAKGEQKAEIRPFDA